MQMAYVDTDFLDISSAIRWHVLAMFVPSFFVGVLIDKAGVGRVIFVGILFLILSAIFNIIENSYTIMVVALILLGIGWNFTYIGGSALLAQETDGMPAAVKIQGANDFFISILATLGAFSPAILMAWLGWRGSNILVAVVCFLLFLIFGFGRITKKHESA